MVKSQAPTALASLCAFCTIVTARQASVASSPCASTLMQSRVRIGPASICNGARGRGHAYPYRIFKVNKTSPTSETLKKRRVSRCQPLARFRPTTLHTSRRTRTWAAIGLAPCEPAASSPVEAPACDQQHAGERHASHPPRRRGQEGRGVLPSHCTVLPTPRALLAPNPPPQSPDSYLGRAKAGALRGGRLKPGRSARLRPATREGEAR